MERAFELRVASARSVLRPAGPIGLSLPNAGPALGVSARNDGRKFDECETIAASDSHSGNLPALRLPGAIRPCHLLGNVGVSMGHVLR